MTLYARRLAVLVFLALVFSSSVVLAQRDQMDGYLGVPQERVPEEFGGGFSMYVAAFPMLEKYPGRRFQSGLFGTWMFPVEREGDPEEKWYTDIEGGLGWWRDTRFATTTPKFIMGGVAVEFSAWANGPGAGKGRDWSRPLGKYGVAQLSPNVIWPPDGLNLAQGMRGELFGYGYLPLPLAEKKKKPAKGGFPTGDQCWTLFVNSANFKGPISFFTPHFFARAAEPRPELFGKLLDARPANPNRAIQMETQFIPSVTARDAKGQLWARVARTHFPADAKGQSVLVHRVTSYRHAALWDGVKAWFGGGEAVTGPLPEKQSVRHVFTGKGWSSWKIVVPGADGGKPREVHVDWKSFATPFALDDHTFAYRWNEEFVTRDLARGLVTLPTYYRLRDERAGKKSRWTPVQPATVPAELKEGLDAAVLQQPRGKVGPYETPGRDAWTKPGPAAGPFTAYPGDGSEVTYAWYRFADQPSIMNAGLTDDERERMQKRVELLHRHWTSDRDYLAPPAKGRLASIDPALVVKPPKGLEIGYVPIVTRQGPRAKPAKTDQR